MFLLYFKWLLGFYLLICLEMCELLSACPHLQFVLSDLLCKGLFWEGLWVGAGSGTLKSCRLPAHCLKWWDLSLLYSSPVLTVAGILLMSLRPLTSFVLSIPLSIYLTVCSFCCVSSNSLRSSVIPSCRPREYSCSLDKEIRNLSVSSWSFWYCSLMFFWGLIKRGLKSFSSIDLWNSILLLSCVKSLVFTVQLYRLVFALGFVPIPHIFILL